MTVSILKVTSNKVQKYVGPWAMIWLAHREKLLWEKKRKFPNCCCAWWKCRIALVLFEQWKTMNSVFPIQSHQSQIGTCLPHVLLTYLCWVALCSEENDKLESRYSNKPKNCSTEKDKKHGPKPHSGILACFAATSLLFLFLFFWVFFSLSDEGGRLDLGMLLMFVNCGLVWFRAMWINLDFGTIYIVNATKSGPFWSNIYNKNTVKL